MNKDKKILLGILILLLAFVGFVGFVVFREKKNDEAPKSYREDAIRFKTEYESLNNQVREKDGKTIKEISISNENPVDILTEEEAVSLVENGTGILYFGFSDCPWCRSMIPVLLDTLNNMSIEHLYYLNVAGIRDTLVLDKKNKVEVETKGTDSYYKLLELMDDVLDPYYLTTKEGKKVDTKEKRIMAPTVIAIKEGKIVDIHVGTVESQKSGYDDLSTEQKEELSNRFMELIKKVYNVECNDAC